MDFIKDQAGKYISEKMGGDKDSQSHQQGRPTGGGQGGHDGYGGGGGYDQRPPQGGYGGDSGGGYGGNGPHQVIECCIHHPSGLGFIVPMRS